MKTNITGKSEARDSHHRYSTSTGYSAHQTQHSSAIFRHFNSTQQPNNKSARTEQSTVTSRRYDQDTVVYSQNKTTIMKPSTDPEHARRTPTSNTTKMKNASMTFSRIAKMSLSDDEHPQKIQKGKGPTSISNLITLTPNQGNKSYTMPVLTRTIPEVSTVADSLSPMTFNDTDQLHEDNSEFAYMRRTPEAEKGEKKAAPVDKVDNNSHQTSDKLFSTPLEPYPHTAPSMTTATDASTVRVIMGSRLYASETNLQTQLYDPEPKSTLQLDDNQDVDSLVTEYAFESDNDEGNKGNTTMETT